MTKAVRLLVVSVPVSAVLVLLILWLSGTLYPAEPPEIVGRSSSVRV